MKHVLYAFGAFVAVALLEACAGARSPWEPTTVGVPSLLGTTGRSSSACAVPDSCIYVTNGSGTITVYPINANGNVPPVNEIDGPNTGLAEPVSIAFDRHGNMYVANFYGTITVYAKGASGNVSPTRTISGSYTGLGWIEGIAVDRSGEIYVSDWLNNRIDVFAANANGNVPPIRVVSGQYTQLSNPAGSSLHDGTETVSNSYTNSLTTYSTSANGDVTPSNTIGGPSTELANPRGNFIRSTTGKYYVVNANCFSGCTPGVLVFASGATGNATPVANISGGNTGLVSPFGIAVGTYGWMYVTDIASGVSAFAAGANGNVAPNRKIYGSYTLLGDPLGIAIH